MPPPRAHSTGAWPNSLLLTRRQRPPLLKVNSMTANLFAMLILSRRRCSSRRSRLGQHRGVPARMRTSLRSRGMKVEVSSIGVGPELFGFSEARHGMVAGDSDRRLCSLRRRSQSRERGRRRCIGAGRPGRKAKRVLQRNRCRRRPRSVDAGQAANFPAAFSTSPASRVSGVVVPGRAAKPRASRPATSTEPRRPLDHAFEEGHQFRQPGARAGDRD
jgi:hypothetical protein